MKNFRLFILAIILCTACSEDVMEFTPTEKFTSIFDNPEEELNYAPLDAIETDDGGFLVLSRLGKEAIFVIKISNRGDFQWSQQLQAQFVNAVDKLIRQGNNYYFIGSTLPDYTATLFEINDLVQSVQAIRTYNAYRNPLAFNYLTSDSYLLLTYNDTTGTVLSKILDGFAMEWARKYDDFDNASQYLASFTNSENAEFIVGAYNSGANIYFNSPRENGMTLSYADGQGLETGKIVSIQGDVVNSVLANQNGTLSLNYMIEDQAFFLNSYQPQVNDSVALQTLEGDFMQDRLSMQRAVTAQIPIGTVDYLLNAYSTLDGRIKLIFYNGQTGQEIAIDYLGGLDPLEVIDIFPTADEGLAVLSKITILGAKERISLIKVPKEELLEIL